MLRVVAQQSRRFSSIPPAVGKLERKVVSRRLFEDIQARVYGRQSSVEKINVAIIMPDGKKEDVLVNRNISTPMTCLKHVAPHLRGQVGLCVIQTPSGDRKVVSANTRLTNSCEIDFLGFKSNNFDYITLVNQAFWRSCSVLTAAALQKVLPAAELNLHSSNVYPLYVQTTASGVVLSDADHSHLLQKLGSQTRQIMKRDELFEVVPLSQSIAEEYELENFELLCKLGDDFACALEGPVIHSSKQISRINFLMKQTSQGELTIGALAIPENEPMGGKAWSIICEEASRSFVGYENEF